MLSLNYNNKGRTTVLKLDKKVIRKIFSMYNKNYTKEDIVNSIKTYYRLEIGKAQLRKKLQEYFGQTKKQKNIGFRLRFIKRIYTQSQVPLKRIVEYINFHFEEKTTLQALCVLASRLKWKRPKKIQPKHLFDISKHDEEDMIKLYKEGLSAAEIAPKYGFKTSKSVYDILKKYNIERRTQEENRKIKVKYSDFTFKKIDSIFKAYYLGILLSDGYISRKDTVGVQMCDKDVVEFIASTLQVNVSIIKKKNPNCMLMYRTLIFGKELVNELVRLGVVEHKSLITPGPNLYDDEKQYLPWILRGLLDGDGWIRKDGKEFFFCSASKEMSDWFCSALISLGMTNIASKFAPNEYNGVYYVRTGIQSNIEILKSKIYNVPYGMKRKYNRLHQIA